MGFNIKAHEQLKHLEESKTPALLKNVIVNNSNEFIFNQQSSVSAAANCDISFAYKDQPAVMEQLKSGSSSLDLGKISELESLSPNQKVNVKGTLTLGGNECKIVRGSQENCPVKEDCIIEDESGHGVIHIWGAAIDQLQDGQTYSFKNLTVKSIQGKVFLSMTPSTTFEKIANSLTHLKGPSILKSEDEEVFVGKFKLISKLSIFMSCQKCKKRIDGDEASCVKCVNCGTHQRASECKREGSVKLCIRRTDEDLWLTCFTDALTTLLKETSSVTLTNSTDEIAEALMNAEGFFLTYNCQNTTVKEVTKLHLATDN